MQKLLSTENSARRVLVGPCDPLVPGAREAVGRAANEQMALSIATGSAPDSEDKDLAKMQANSLVYGQIEALIDAFQTGSAPVVDDIMGARIDPELTSTVERDGLAALAREQDAGERACAKARADHLAAKSACDWYEANYVPNPSWAPYYDRLDARVLLVVLLEALTGVMILISSGSVADGFDTVIPAYLLGTYLNFKLSGYIGRASFHIRLSPLRAKIRLGGAVGTVGITLVLQNVMLGLMRGGLELSVPALIRAVAEPLTLAPAVTMGAITLTGIGLALVSYIAFGSFQKLNRGFTEEYARLRAEKERTKAAVDTAHTTSVGRIDTKHNEVVGALDDAFEDEADVLAEAKEARDRLETGARRLCRTVVSVARATEQMVDTYNQRFAATWSARGPVPEHYRVPARLDREELRRHIPGTAEALAVTRQIGALTTNLDALREARGTAKAAIAEARDRAVSALRAAAYGPIPSPTNP